MKKGSIKTFTSLSAGVIAGAIAMHAPLPLDIAALIAAGVVTYHNPQLASTIEQKIEMIRHPMYLLQEREVTQDVTRQKLKKYGFWERMLGFHLQAEQQEVEREPSVKQSNFLDYAPAAPPLVAVAAPPVSPDNHISLTDNMIIVLEQMLGKAIFVCGIRRHGKTTFGARLAEQLGKFYTPIFIPDAEGDYLSVVELLPRGVIAGHSSANDEYLDVEFAAIDTEQQAYQLGWDIFECGYQVILDLNSYEGGIAEGAKIWCFVLRGMFAWANKHPSSERVNAHIWMDEAQRYLPQNDSESLILDAVVREELLRLYNDMIGAGGKRGLVPVVLTQRIAQVKKQLIGQAEIRVFFRQTLDLDIKRCAEYLIPEGKEDDIKRNVSVLAPGQAYFIDYAGVQHLVKFLNRDSDGSRSKTPSAAAALKYADMPMALSRQQQQNNLPELMEKIDTVKVEQVSTFEKAVSVYREGNKGLPSFALAMQMSRHQQVTANLFIQVKNYVEGL